MAMFRGYDVVSVSEFIREFGADRTKEMLASYRSVRDSSTEVFLRDKAVDMEMYDLCRTFIAVTEDRDILGFVTLGIKCLSVPKDNLLSGKTMRRMNIESRTGWPNRIFSVSCHVPQTLRRGSAPNCLTWPSTASGRRRARSDAEWSASTATTS